MCGYSVAMLGEEKAGVGFGNYGAEAQIGGKRFLTDSNGRWVRGSREEFLKSINTFGDLQLRAFLADLIENGREG